MISQFTFFSGFHWSSPIGKCRLTPVSLVDTTESYKVSLATLNRQTSYDPGILRQDYKIIRQHYGIIHGSAIGLPSG